VLMADAVTVAIVAVSVPSEPESAAVGRAFAIDVIWKEAALMMEMTALAGSGERRVLLWPEPSFAVRPRLDVVVRVVF